MRRARAPKREIAPDIRYNSVLVAKLVNKVMMNGKKSLAMRIVYGAFDLVERRTGRPAMEIFEKALANTKPLLEVRPRRVGGATYQIPLEVPPDRQVSLALRWIVNAARERPGKSMIEKLAAELIDAANGTGAAVKKREDTHRMAEANRAFAHYRW